MVDVPEASSQLIVIGASAGGVEALSTLVSTLPDGFPVPIVIAQHLDPKRPSHLAEILGRRSRLPVETVTEHEPLVPGVVYVIPSNRHVEISDHAITLRSDVGERPKPSVDLLLTTAAGIYGENLIAVILTGSGSDGTIGAREVKKAGGTVVIQNPQTASFPSMPGSLAPNTVDIVADLERIGPLLHELVTGVYVPPRVLEDQGFLELLNDVREKSGIDFNNYKPGTIQRRLHRRLVAVGAANLAQYTEYLKTHPDEYQRLVSSFLIKVTEFMRDPELFTHLREQILPELILRARERGGDLRLWSAGCATGEEAYSLAILVCEVLGDALEHFNVRIFGTDLDSEAIAFARQGIYPASVVEDLPGELLDRYFNEIRGSYQIKKRVRSLTVFGEHDQGQRAPFPRIDLVMSRNVLIYFTSELQTRALQLFAFSLNDRGYLVLGKAENTSPLSEYFTPYHSELKIYQRHGGRGVILAPRLTAPSLYLTRPSSPKARPVSRVDPPATELERVRSATHNLLLNLPLGVVLVDARYDILEINSAARRLLFIHQPAIGEDFVHLAQNLSSREMRAAIDAVLREDSPRSLETSIDTAELEKPSHLRLSFHSHKAEMRDGSVRSVLILVDDITQIVEVRRRLEDGNANQVRLTEELRRALEEIKTANVGLQERNRQLEAAIGDLAGVRRQAEQAKDHAERRLEGLAEVNRELVAANEQLTYANEQLRSANEEFLLTTQETQAATEEVETLNEELQASNEELETLNEELQATIEELNTTYADLQARGLELRDLAATGDRERRGLSAILASLDDAVVVVDRAGKYIQTNASFESMFAGKFAPQDENGRLLAPEETPQARAAQGQSFRLEFTASSPDGMGRRYFEATGRPIQRHEGGELEGGLIVIRDITGRKT